MDIVTFETAKKLKDAGFLQPVPEVNQFWYGLIRAIQEPLIMLNKSASGKWCSDKYQNQHQFDSFNDFGVFAPTSTDIMQQTKGVYLCEMQGGGWGVFMVGTSKMVGFDPENAAEACAEAYFTLNKT